MTSSTSDKATTGDRRDEVAALIAELEKCGPSFRLEQEIMWAVCGVRPEHRSDNDKPPAYTQSIDAALTLFPESAEWECGSAKLVSSYWAATVTRDAEHKAKGRTAAIALCIAALKARAADTTLRSPVMPQPRNEEVVVP